MKKIIYLFCFLLTVSICLAQKSYEFDYVLEYNISPKSENNSVLEKGYTKYDFINSKDNSYILTVSETKEKINMWLTLSSGQTFFGDIIKGDFFVEAISLKCPKNWFKNNSDYENLKDFQLNVEDDTIINTEVFKQFALQPLNKKDIKKFNLKTFYYIVDNKFNFKYPILQPTGALFRKWKKGEKIPNGFVKEVYEKTDKGKRVLMELVQCVPTKKIILIDDKCK